MSEISLKEKIVLLSLKFQNVKQELSKKVIGQNELLESLIIALLANGHILLEGVPGLAKTLSINTLAKVVNTNFRRIQFTPDLLPGDLTGTSIFDQKNNEFFVKKGPIFTNLLLADEINRAPAKVQTALLEAMQEKQITIGSETFLLPEVFLVMATQNPIEHEGTYPLPEAQLDRFMLKVSLSYPSPQEEYEILNLSEQNEVEIKQVIDTQTILDSRSVIKSIYVDERIKKYIIDLVFATRNPEDYKLNFSNYLDYGASPRAGIYLLLCSKVLAFLDKRDFVLPEDIKKIAFNILNHRIALSYEALANQIKPKDIITELLNKIKIS